jgi:hypothetical protein
LRQKAIRCCTLSSRMLPSVIGGPGGGFGAPKEPSDEEILKGLAWELQGDFKAAGVISFAIAYLANHVREMKVIATGEVTRTATKVVVVEEHGLDGGTRLSRDHVLARQQADPRRSDHSRIGRRQRLRVGTCGRRDRHCGRVNMRSFFAEHGSTMPRAA